MLAECKVWCPDEDRRASVVKALLDISSEEDAKDADGARDGAVVDEVEHIVAYVHMRVHMEADTSPTT